MQLVRGVEPLMAVLGIAWLLLAVLELTRGLGSTATVLSRTIWVVFIADFGTRLLIAPDKLLYLRRHWIVALSLALPALRLASVLRVGRLARVARSIRGVRLLRTLTSVNRAIASLRASMRRRGFGYVMAMTMVVTLGGAAGMYALEQVRCERRRRVSLHE